MIVVLIKQHGYLCIVRVLAYMYACTNPYWSLMIVESLGTVEISRVNRVDVVAIVHIVTVVEHTHTQSITHCHTHNMYTVQYSYIYMQTQYCKAGNFRGIIVENQLLVFLDFIFIQLKTHALLILVLTLFYDTNFCAFMQEIPQNLQDIIP